MKLVGGTTISEQEVKALLVVLQKGEQSKGATIRALFAGGLEVKNIAELTGIRYNHVYNVVKAEILKHGLEIEVSNRSRAGSKRSKIVELLQEGKSITEVAQEVQSLYNYVWQIAKAEGLTKSAQEAIGEVV